MILSRNSQTPILKLLAEYGGGKLPDIAGFYSGALAICGDAACVWSDLEALGCRVDAGKGSVARAGFHFMTINKIGETFPGDIEHWYSNSAALVKASMAARRQEYAGEFLPPNHTHSCHDGAMWRWPWPGSGTSAYGAMLTGVALGYEPVVLCGIPLDDSPHNGEPPWRRTKFASSEAPEDDPHWRRARTFLKGAVFSMSGRTRELFGPPR